jgi:HEPN domain-containing protein
MSDPELHAEVRRWLRFAREDLEAAENARSRMAAGSPVPRHICWMAQQAAEKALKAALISLQIEFPFSHDLDLLRNLLPGNWKVTQSHPDLASLTEWAVEARYPGDWPDATEQDAHYAADEARAVFESVRTDLANLDLIE